MFNFFLKSYRSELLSFCGSKVKVQYDPNGPDSKECFRMYEDGQFKGLEFISTRQPNIVEGIIIGKKSWGLWKNEWIDGIVEGSFTKFEILQEFKQRNIIIPDSLFEDFNNTLWKRRFEYEEKNLNGEHISILTYKARQI